MLFFEEFDFSILNDPDFKEDSVREELITPLLKALGYSVFGENKIIRSKSLFAHVNIGSQKQKINITPDYLLKVGDNISWILDAKHPKENILDGKHREQAFSYAILPNVKAYYYALCNGKEIIFFHIAKTEPVIHIFLSDIDNELNSIIKVLSPNFIKRHYFTQQGDNGVLYLMDKMEELDLIYNQMIEEGKLHIRKSLVILGVIEDAVDIINGNKSEFETSIEGKRNVER
ncbi:MAG: type I restriction enzyme HsdR N-terminal domain-containing protein [Methylococcales bacterium]|nr:type I restriction enzyme HsdR N-terminal domain-containing protein [Methylococcales bacterium]